MPTDFNLPELGENITAGDVLRVLVQPGDMLAKEQPVLELETDKATIEVPSSMAGQVRDIKVKAGDKVKVGQAILTVDDGAAAQGGGPRAGKLRLPRTRARRARRPRLSRHRRRRKLLRSQRGRASVDSGQRQRRRLQPWRAAATRNAAASGDAGGASRAVGPPDGPRAGRGHQRRSPARADGGRISVEDVKAHAKRLLAGGADAAASSRRS